MNISFFFTEFNFISVIIRLVLATILGGIIGLERGKHGHPAGLRTHSLVCVGAATAMMVGFFVVSEGYTADVSRIGAQVVSGIGFLGVGTILIKGRDQITGLTTAAALWASGAIGLACGAGFWLAAVAATIIIMVVNTILQHLSNISKSRGDTIIYMELSDISTVNNVYDGLKEKYGNISIHTVPAKSALNNHIGLEATFNSSITDLPIHDLVKDLRQIPEIIYAVEAN